MGKSCLDMDTLAKIISGNLSAEESERIQAHILTCDSCFERVASAAFVFNDPELDQCKPLSNSRVQSIMRRLNSKNGIPRGNASTVIDRFSAWCRDVMPLFPLKYGYARNSDPPNESGRAKYVNIEKDFAGLSAAIFFEKLEACFNMHIKIKVENGVAKNIRVNLNSSNGCVSRLLKDGYVCFEDVIFGSYRISIIQKNIEKGVCTFDINEAGINER